VASRSDASVNRDGGRGGRRTLAEHEGVSSPATRLLPPPSRSESHPGGGLGGRLPGDRALLGILEWVPGTRRWRLIRRSCR